MLVLARKVGERIIIGEGDDQIVLVVLRIDGNRVRLGLDAGDHIHIIRGELEVSDAA